MTLVSFPPFRIDLAEERVWRTDEQLALRRKPFAILRYLVANPRRLVTHDELLKEVWGGAVVSESSMRSHVHELRQVLGDGVIETVVGRGYRFVAELASAEPAPADSTPDPVAGADRVVGRDGELGVLTAALDRAIAGQRQICFVTGEPGIGKTTLVDAFLATLARRNVLVARGHCVEQYGTPEAYLAIIELLGRLRRSARGDQTLAALLRYAPSFLVQVPQLVPDAELAELERRARGAPEARMMRELIEALESLCLTEPLVIVLEDLQWSDVATIDLVSLLGQRKDLARLLVIATSRRAEAQTVSHPLNRVMRGLVARGGAIAVPLAAIDRKDIRRYIAIRFPDHVFGEDFLEVVDHVTGGTPLFLASFLDDLVDRKMIAQRDGRWALAMSLDEVATHRPESVRQLIDIQLDRLAAPEQRALEAASVIGAEFASALVAAALAIPHEAADEICDGLARRALFLVPAGNEEWPDGSLQPRYRVTHALVQEVCFERSPASRRQRLHKSIADHLAGVFGDRAPEIAHILATHYEHAGLVTQAVHHYVSAGERTAQRFSNHDASRLFVRAAALVHRLPESRERDAIELRILFGVSQASVLNADAGTHQPLAMFERMIELARRLDDAPQLFVAMASLLIRTATLADYSRATAIGEELAAIASTVAIPDDLLAFADCARSLNAMWNGRLDVAIPLLERFSEGRVVRKGLAGILGATDQFSLMLIFLATLRWLRGEPDRAVATALRAIEQATRTGDPYTIGAGYVGLARLRFWRGDAPDQIREAAERTLAIPEADVWHVQASLLAGVARAQQGPLGPADIAELTRLFRARTTGFPMGKTALGLPMIEVLRRSNEAGSALALVDEMLEFARRFDEHLLEAELVRLRAELIEATDPTAATAGYREAITVARTWGSRALELRAAIRLAAIARDADSLAQLAAALAPFTEGAGTRDVAEARRLLG